MNVVILVSVLKWRSENNVVEMYGMLVEFRNKTAGWLTQIFHKLDFLNELWLAKFVRVLLFRASSDFASYPIRLFQKLYIFSFSFWMPSHGNINFWSSSWIHVECGRNYKTLKAVNCDRLVDVEDGIKIRQNPSLTRLFRPRDTR